MTKSIKEHAEPSDVHGYVKNSVEGFVNYPPGSDFENGFLAAMLIVAEEALGQRMDLPPFAEATLVRHRYSRK